MKRNDFQKLCRLRIKEAEILLDANEYSGAYYLSGYALECAFKSCIAKSYLKHAFPDKMKVNKSHTHNLEVLMKVADLEHRFSADSASNEILSARWTTAKDWSELSRYEFKTEIEAENLYLAISDRNNGILKWIQQYW